MRAQRAAELKAQSRRCAGQHALPAPDYGDGGRGGHDGSGEPAEGQAIEVANRQHSIADLQARINEYRSRLNSAPAREQELADLTRDHEQSQKDYDTLLARKQSALSWPPTSARARKGCTSAPWIRPAFPPSLFLPSAS